MPSILKRRFETDLTKYLNIFYKTEFSPRLKWTGYPLTFHSFAKLVSLLINKQGLNFSYGNIRHLF